MTITRNGVKYELTREELAEAHVEYQRLIDTEKVREDMPLSEIFDALPEEYKVEFCEIVGTDAAHKCDRYGCNWGDAVDAAFEEYEHLLAPMYARAMLSDKEPFCSMSTKDADAVFDEIGDGVAYYTEGSEHMTLAEALKTALEEWVEICEEARAIALSAVSTQENEPCEEE